MSRHDDLLALGLAIAREAGALLLDRPVDLEFGTKSTPTDVVTAMDRASEELIARRLQEARPGDGMLGEEGTDEPGSTAVRWIVDPLDGTVNYLYQLPFWAVSIAAEVDGEVVAGVVHAPVLGWTFTATKGGGSWLHRDGTTTKLVGSPVTELSKTLLGTGFGYAADRRRIQGVWVAALLPEIRDIRRQGSGALDLCMTALALLDAYVEQGLSPWDVAAGALVAREAGLTVTGLHGTPASYSLVVSAPPGIAPALLARLEELDADATPPGLTDPVF